MTGAAPTAPSPNPRDAAASALRILLRATAYSLAFLIPLAITFLILRVPPLQAMRSLWSGAFGDASTGHLASLSSTLVETTPLLLTGLGVVVAWRAGLFSIGGEGQLLMGALAATAVAKAAAPAPAPLITLAMIVAACAAGAAWGALAAWLRVRRNVQEVISTIMLNYVARYVASWLVLGILQEHTHHNPQSESLPNAVLFARILPRAWSDNMQTSLHAGILLAIAAVPLIALFLYRTAAGFELRVVGQNAEAARAARYPVNRLRVQAMAISGGLCGLAGAIELLGSGTGSLPATGFSPGWGYTAVPVALLGGLHPVGALGSALFFGALTQGCRNLAQFQGVPTVLIYLVQGMAVLAVVGARAWRARRDGGDTD